MKVKYTCMASIVERRKTNKTINAKEELSSMTFEDALAMVSAPAVVLA